MKNKRDPDYRRRRPDRLPYRRSRRAGAAARNRDPRQLRARPPGEPARRRRRGFRLTIIEGDIRDRALLAKAFDGHRHRVPPGGDPHHAVRGRAAAGVRRAGRRAPSTCSKPRCKAGVSKVVAASSASVLGSGRELPDDREPSSLQQPDDLRRGQGVQRGAAAQLRRDVRAELRGAALLQRLRAAHGRLRRLYGSAHPLDGAHCRRRAADHLRRRQPDDGLRPCPRHRARQPPRREIAMSPTRCSTSPAAPKPACANSPTC